MVYSMGGALHVPGNVQQAPAAEWNFYCDPVSVQQVFAADVPITLVPLDVTNRVPVTRESLSRFSSQQHTPAARLANRLVESQRREIEAGGIYYWDPLAAALLTDESFSMIQEMPVLIQAGDGQTVEEATGRRVRVVTGTDAVRFQQMLVQVLNGKFN